MERPCYFNASSAAHSRRAPEQPQVVRASLHEWSLNKEFSSASERTAPAFFTLPCSQFVGRCASEDTASGYHLAAQRRGHGPDRPRLHRLPPSVSVSSSGAARRKTLPVATTPWRSAERKAQVSRSMEHLPLPSTRPLPNPSVNATRTSRPLGARGRPAYHRPRAPSVLPARARYLKR